MNSFVINNCQVYLNKKIVKRSLYIQNGVLKQISNKPIDKQNIHTIDCHGLIAIPGLVDIHVHLREPGQSYKETIKTGTMAAAAGGYTTVCCMPNVVPPPDTVSNINTILSLIQKDAIINVYPYASITAGRKINTKIVDMDKLSKHCFAFSNDGCGVSTSQTMEQAMTKAKRVNKAIVAHTEDLKYVPQCGSVHDGINVKKFNLVGIPSEAEYKQVERDVQLAIKAKCQYHICHVSCKQTLDLIKKAKKHNKHISCEVTPHHLLLNETSIKTNNGKYKMNPPLRSKKDQQALIQGIKSGLIEVIATDHAPHANKEKNTTIDKAAFGISLLDYSFALLYTKLVKTNIISLNKLVELMSINPSKLFNLHSNELKINQPVNLLIFDPSKKSKINSKNFFSKGKSTPFEGINCVGWPKITICNGKIVYKEGRIYG